MSNPTLEDLEYDFVCETDGFPTEELLNEYVERYPQFHDQLVDFAVWLAIDHVWGLSLKEGGALSASGDVVAEDGTARPDGCTDSQPKDAVKVDEHPGSDNDRERGG